jgi:hypothetical protein
MFIELGTGLAADTKVLVVDLEEEESDTIEGFGEFLDVWHAKEIIDRKASLAGIENPNTNQKVNLLIEYAENNA